MPSKHNILIVQDAAYATLVYGRERLSILGRPGGKDVAVELHSMSKSYNMTGWRLGFVAGNAQAVKAFAEVKDNIDSGQFKAIQLAACAGIADKQLSEAIKNHYERRLKKLVATLKKCGFDAEMPGGTFYLYVPAPKAAGRRNSRPRRMRPSTSSASTPFRPCRGTMSARSCASPRRSSRRATRMTTASWGNWRKGWARRI